jgi:hypothetical protein
MKTILTLLLSTLFVTNLAHAQKQKIKIKDGYALVDDEQYVKWDDRSSLEASIQGLNAEGEEIVALWLNYPDPARVSSANPKGLVNWVELYFPTLDLRCEIEPSTRKNVIQWLLDHNIYVDGELNAENVEKLVKRQGMRYSESRPNSVKVIINN